MSDDILISVNEVSRYYGSRCALNNVSFDARKGEITAFLGPNGAGKSTLMQIICGVLASSSGKISIANHDILEQPLQAKNQLGYLPEQPPLYLDCTVDEYLRYCGRLRKITSQDIEKQVGVCKEKCGLKDTGKRIISHLSKGYQQRLGLAQAILHSPQVLILDEPSSGLDPRQMIEMRELIRNIGQDHCVILSTHILAEAQDICDRILIINLGNIVLDRPMKELETTEYPEDIVIIELSNPPQSLQAITGLAGVTNAASTGHNRFRVTGDRDVLAGSLANAASSNNWGLTGLSKETGSLEQIYVQLTQDNSTSINTQNHDH